MTLLLTFLFLSSMPSTQSVMFTLILLGAMTLQAAFWMRLLNLSLSSITPNSLADKASVCGLWIGLPSNTVFSPPAKDQEKHNRLTNATQAEWNCLLAMFWKLLQQKRLEPVSSQDLLKIISVPTMRQAKFFLKNLVSVDYHACNDFCQQFAFFTHCPVLMQVYSLGEPIFIKGVPHFDSKKFVLYQDQFYVLHTV
mmetsp:Transcript_32370/g.47357  ORF Transcript_32370/g.47357 Transcript_32370/m.47357 type:complete len:196 (+) Transcript_32370:197-784(+)